MSQTSGIEREFKREFNDICQKNFAICALYPELLALVEKGDLFPAIREGAIDFYHKGQRALHRRQNSFTTNSHFIKPNQDDGVKNRDISIDAGTTSLSSTKILERCREKAKKSSPEALLLSKIFPFLSFAVKHENKNFPILIDIEARFAPIATDKTDKIDLVFLLPQTCELLFVEGKRRSDPRIRSSSKAILPEVVGQVTGYCDQLIKREDQILKAYTDASNVMAKIFKYSFPAPTKILKKVPILVIGDNNPEKDSLVNVNAKDEWLECELAKTGSAKYRIWCKDGVLLIDARSIFLDLENGIGDLAAGLNELADKIRTQY